MSRLANPSVSLLRPVGAWRLHPGRAISLQPVQASWLHLRRGRVWATLGEPSALSPQASGDRFLDAGDTLLVPAGARLVMEPLAPSGTMEPVYFDWTEAEPVAPAPGRFRREVAAPARDLGVALGQAAVAAWRVARGVLGYGEFLVAGRGRVLTPLESMRS